jgi:hypothetical protein
MDIADLVHRLDARPNGDGWSAKCPAHDDRTPSLSISEGADARILLHCHAGCDNDTILAKLGLTSRDLFQNGGAISRTRPESRIVATYDYRDANGNMIFQTVRYEPKDFSQRRPDGNGGWIWNLDGIEPVLFRLPEIAKDIREGLPIFFCEGEKDVLALVEHGFAATCNPMGAKKWRDSYSETLCGADVIIIADKDQAGRGHAQLVASKIHSAAKFVRVIEPPDVNKKSVKDAADYFAAGGDADQLVALADNATEWTPAAGQETATENALPVIQDAAMELAKPHDLPPDVIEGIVHLGGKMILGGASKTFKTWSLIDLAASVATGAVWFNGYATKKGAVLLVNFELPEPFFWNRVRTVCDERQLTIEPGMLHVWNLRGHILDWAKLQQQIQSGTYVLIILDPIYKLLLGRDENRAGDIASLLNELEMLAVRSGAAVAFGAHYSKGNQAQKESIDRIGGSGVFGRDPDTILNFTRHEEQDCFTVEMTLRNHPPQNPFVVRWEYPLFVVDSLLDPNRLKQAGGRPRLATQTQILDLLDEKPLKAVEWQKRAREEFGIASSTFWETKRELQESGRIQSAAGLFNKT